jgi:hypothetical protein
MVKGFNLPIDYVLYEMSYTNMIMYCSVLPSYGSGKPEDNKQGEVINADDPANEEIVSKALFG